MLPQIGDLGYVLDQQARDTAVPAGIDSALAIYQKQAFPGRALQVRVYLYPDVNGAKQQFKTVAEAFRNPPPEVFGTATRNLDYGAVSVGDEQKAYITEQTDRLGNKGWTDIVRQGRAVIITQLLGPAAEDQRAVRQAVVTRIVQRAP